jgi:multicomponent Na+:H+ antiporter subunit D
MFMAAGSIYAALGHDRIAELRGIARAMPMTVLAFLLAGLALIGLPPSGAYVAKTLLVDAADRSGQWWWELVLQGGAFLTGSYVVLVLAHALAPAKRPVALVAPAARLSEAAALALALCSLLLGLAPWDTILESPLTIAPSIVPQILSSALWPLLGGAVLAVLFGRWGYPPLPGGGLALISPARRASDVVEQLDRILRQWPAACICFLLVAMGLGAALYAGR